MPDASRRAPRGGPQSPNPSRRATDFRQDTAFKSDYYAVKSHCVSPIASWLALPTPSRRAPRRISGKIRPSSKNTAFKLLRAEISWCPDHYIPPCPYGPAISASSRLLPSRLLRSEISLRPAAPSAGLCGGKEGKGMAAKSDTAMRETAARRPAYTWRSRCRPRGRGAPGTSRPTMGATVRVHGCGHGVCMVRGHGVHGA